jgi:large subunit ribosomal protein L22
METRSIYRFARISPFKAREVTREIQGLPVQQALDLLAFTPKKAAGLVAKTLKSAVVGEGPTFQRFIPKARGSAGPIRKRTSHIRIILTDEIEIQTRETRKAAKKKTASKKPAAKKKAAVKKEETKPAAEATAPAAEKAE